MLNTTAKINIFNYKLSPIKEEDTESDLSSEINSSSQLKRLKRISRYSRPTSSSKELNKESNSLFDKSSNQSNASFDKYNNESNDAFDKYSNESNASFELNDELNTNDKSSDELNDESNTHAKLNDGSDTSNKSELSDKLNSYNSNKFLELTDYQHKCILASISERKKKFFGIFGSTANLTYSIEDLVENPLSVSKSRVIRNKMLLESVKNDTNMFLVEKQHFLQFLYTLQEKYLKTTDIHINISIIGDLIKMYNKCFNKKLKYIDFDYIIKHDITKNRESKDIMIWFNDYNDVIDHLRNKKNFIIKRRNAFIKNELVKLMQLQNKLNIKRPIQEY